MEFIIQKSLELGVYSIVPVFTARTVVSPGVDFAKKIIRWQKVAVEAVKQCRRGIIPEIEKDVSFSEMVEIIKAGKFDTVLFPFENEENFSIKNALRKLEETPKHVAVIIGPEGGFSDDEASQLTKACALRVSLGKTILRTETAGPAAIAMIMYELEL
jgi:16S rRNA (uracil1498-N3)-methyltransferase